MRRGPDGRWSTPTPLVTGGCNGEWSPDGRWIAYVAFDRDVRIGVLMVIPAAGGPARRVLTPQSDMPRAGGTRWAPDGRTLYFKGHDAGGRASFWSVPFSGGRPRLLVRFDDPAFSSSRNDFSTDGRNFYFAVEDRQSDVFVADLIKH